MKSIIPYTKNISLGTKIAEITSMSLEHELNVAPEEITGNFIISGEYRSHEVSVNREPFLQKLPFSIELTENIDLESLKFEIVDFSYDVLNDDTIEVDIEFSLEADEVVEDLEETKEEDDERNLFESVDPIVEPDLSAFLDVVAEDPEKDEEVKSTEKEEQKEESLYASDVREEEVEEVKEDMKESEDAIIKNVNPMDDSYATYHIHIVKEGESIETICTMYQSNMNLLADYNDMKELAVGDKVIIPKEDE